MGMSSQWGAGYKYGVAAPIAITSQALLDSWYPIEAVRPELKDLFARIYETLRPGGLFIFDMAEPGYVRGANPQKTHSEGKDWAILLEKKEDKKRNKLTRQLTIFRKVENLYRRSEEVHCVQLYKGSEIAKELRQIGFRVRIIRGYGELRFRKAHVGFIATKA